MRTVSFLTLPIIVVLGSCTGAKPTATGAADSLTETERNCLAQARPAETVSIPASRLQALLTKYGAGNLLLRDEQTGQFVVNQTLETDGNAPP